MMKLQIKRIYDATKAQDGYRVLVDRLWPRGVSKTKAKIDLWPKDATPSTKLRRWFHKNKKGNFKDFSKKYERELLDSKGLTKLKKDLRGKKNISIVTAVKDVKNSHVPTLVKLLRK